MSENFTSELRSWWRALDAPWQRIFKIALDINHTPTDTELQEILKLEAIDCSGKSIISLEPLQQLKFLQRLDASNTKIHRLDRISGLHKLVELNISGTDVRSLEPLKQLTHLWSLHCKGCPIVSLTGLQNLGGLGHLDVQGTAITSLEPIAYLPHLKNVIACDTQLSDEASTARLEGTAVTVLHLNTPLAEARLVAAQQNEDAAALLEKDSLFEEAARCIVLHQQGSTSLLQRKLKLGYSRAGRLIDQLERAGVVGPFDGVRARDVLVPDEYQLELLLSGQPYDKLVPAPPELGPERGPISEANSTPVQWEVPPKEDGWPKIKAQEQRGWLRRLFS